MYAAFALVVSAFLPFLNKFGYEKFRAFQIVIYCVFGLGVSRLLDAEISIKMDWIPAAPAPVLYAGIFLAGVVLIFISMGVSIRIYRKTDLA